MTTLISLLDSRTVLCYYHDYLLTVLTKFNSSVYPFKVYLLLSKYFQYIFVFLKV